MIRVTEFKVTGNVQDVGLRFYISKLAESLDVKGEVWNTSDGSVEGVVVGDRVRKFLNGLRDGPGRIDAVMHNEAAGKEYDSFEIGRSR